MATSCRPDAISPGTTAIPDSTRDAVKHRDPELPAIGVIGAGWAWVSSRQGRYSSDMPASSSRRALLLICAVAVAVGTNYTIQGPVLGLIRAEFALSSADAGAIATAFFVGAATTMLAGGAIADRIGMRPAVTLGFLLVAVGNLGAGLLAPSFPALLGWRVLGGLGSGFGFAAGASYTGSIFDDRGRHLAQGLYGASFLLGSGITLAYIPTLAGPSGDWRLAFTLSALAVAVVWVVWTLLAPGEPRAPAATGARVALAIALRARNTWLLALCHTCGFGMAIVISTWVTLFLADAFGLPIAAAGLIGSLTLVTGIAARASGGVILEAGMQPVRLIRAGLALAVIGLTLIALAPTLPVAIVGLVVAGLGVGFPYAAVFNGAAASVRTSPASAQAIVGWGGLLTAIIGPPLVGTLLDATGDFAAGFLALAAIVAGVLVLTWLIRPFDMAVADLGTVDLGDASAAL
jgi:nitrate/nitrite transporter NarK